MHCHTMNQPAREESRSPNDDVVVRGSRSSVASKFRSRRDLGRAIGVLLFMVGFAGTAIVMASLSDECSAQWGTQSRVITLFPPGLRCTGPRDEWSMPWQADGSSALYLGVVCGLSLGAIGRAVLVAGCGPRSGKKGS